MFETKLFHPKQNYLALDIGGTHTRIARITIHARSYEITAVQEVLTEEITDIAETINTLIHADPRQRISGVTIAVAGPITADRTYCQGTHFSWSIDTKILQEKTGIKNIILLNDFEAIAFGLNTLTTNAYVELTSFGRNPGTTAIIGAGTGLGAAIAIYNRGSYRPFPSEGGHVDLSLDTRDPIEEKLARYLKRRKILFEAESILSGRGLVELYCFFAKGLGKLKTIPLTLRPATVTKFALQNKDKHALRACALFIKIYARHARILALHAAASELVIAGGIAPRMLPLFAETFIEYFTQHERKSIRDMLEQITVLVLTDERVALHGCVYVQQQ